ncbi:hypothetical protein D3C75_1345340 [compost metagenome]
MVLTQRAKCLLADQKIVDKKELNLKMGCPIRRFFLRDGGTPFFLVIAVSLVIARNDGEYNHLFFRITVL